MNRILNIALTLALGLSACTGCENPLKNNAGDPSKHKPYTPELTTHYFFDSILHSVEGRYEINQDKSVTLASPASNVRFLVAGTRAQFSARAEFEEAFIDILVDGKLVIQAYKLNQANHTLNVNLGENASTSRLIEIYNRGEGDNLATRLITLTTEQPILSSAKPNRKLIFLGASATCGALSEVDEQCSLTSSAHNGRLSHGPIIARALNAESHLVCRSGRGILNGGQLSIPQDAIHFLDYTLTNASSTTYWDHGRFVPDGVIIALGNNDDLNNQQIFTSAYHALIIKLRTLYPQATLILTEGPLIWGDRKLLLTEYLNLLVKAVNDIKVVYIPSKTYDTNHCSGHPDANTHQNIAVELTPLIKEKLGW